MTVSPLHTFELTVTWTGNDGEGTSTYRSYRRDHEITRDDAPLIAGSADRAFRGDPNRWNPEQLLVAAVSQCHMLWYLHLAAEAGVVVDAYVDQPTGVLDLGPGIERFTSVTLRPLVTVRDASMVEQADALHAGAHERCYVARSLDCPVSHEPRTVVAG